LKLARIYLWIGLVSSVAFGGLYLATPAAMADFSGIETTNSAGLIDFRATYAGFQLGMAAWLAWCLRDEKRYAAGLVAFACVVAGLGSVRLMGLAVDGFSAEMAAATAIEFAMSGAALYAAAQLD